MKNLKFSLVLLLASGSLFATNQVKENFNHGCEWISKVFCWNFCYVNLTKCPGSVGINNYHEAGLAYTRKLSGYCDYAKIYSPYGNFDGTGTVSFKHKLTNNSGKHRRLRVYLLKPNGQVEAKIFDHTYINSYSVNGNPSSTQAESIPVTWTGVYKVVWLWTGSKGHSRGLIDDIEIDAVYSSDPWNWCKPIIPQCTDSDGDGCCDKDDAFPNDPTKCDVIYVPSENTYNSFAYEDLWPATGDFDFNDKVIDRYTVYGVDPNGDIIDAEHTFVLRAAGAGFHNGFGFSMPALTPGDIDSVHNSYNNPYAYTTLNPNGTEANQSTAVVIVWDDWKAIRTITKNGAFFNTVVGGGEGYADTITVKVSFSSPQQLEDVEMDPFLIRDGLRDREIHLPWFQPTDLVDFSHFNTRQDASALDGVGNNYVDANNIPWAIYTPLGAFQWPVEYQDITTVYFDFAAWAASDGTQYTDWYSNSNRDNSKVY